MILMFLTWTYWISENKGDLGRQGILIKTYWSSLELPCGDFQQAVGYTHGCRIQIQIEYINMGDFAQGMVIDSQKWMRSLRKNGEKR